MFYSLPETLRKWSANPENLRGKLFPGEPENAIPNAIQWVRNDIRKHLSKTSSRNLSDIGNKKAISALNIIAIGDVVTNGLLQSKAALPFLKYCFYDNKTQRDEVFAIRQRPTWQHRVFTNPAGYINQEIFSFIKDTYPDSQQYLVEIDGEEDIVVLAAVLNAIDSYIFYGQPPLPMYEPPISAGCVVIQVNLAVQAHFNEIFKKMKKIPAEQLK
jgi:uncharacterized protein (UPF0218 family)